MQRSRLLITAVAVLCLAAMSVGQVENIGGGRHHRDPAEDTLKEMERNRQKELNSKRQEEIKRDTEKLLQLSNELKAYVEKTNENMLSVEVIKKAEEIEKLSKNIQKKMRDSY